MKAGIIVKGLDGLEQILTTEQEARRLSKEFIERGVRFSTNPVSLDDIFYYIVKRPIDEDEDYKRHE